MTIKVKELPECERPYEKLETYGADKLSNAELISDNNKKWNERRNLYNASSKVIEIKRREE